MKVQTKRTAIALANGGIYVRMAKRIPVNYNEALKWYQLSAAKGDYRATAQIGLMYEPDTPFLQTRSKLLIRQKVGRGGECLSG
jgi:TPR repeat protein